MGMNRDEDRQLWDLLSRSKGPTPSPFFARNVVRVVRSQSGEGQGLTARFSLRRLVPALSAAAVVAIAAFSFQLLHHQNRSSQPGSLPIWMFWSTMTTAMIRCYFNLRCR